MRVHHAKCAVVETSPRLLVFRLAMFILVVASGCGCAYAVTRLQARATGVASMCSLSRAW